MEDPRSPVEKLVDTIDEMILALTDLKKIILPLMDIFPNDHQTKKK